MPRNSQGLRYIVGPQNILSKKNKKLKIIKKTNKKTKTKKTKTK